MNKSIFDGKIILNNQTINTTLSPSTSTSKKIMNIKLNMPTIDFEDTLMKHFKSLGLNGQERGQLSLNHRKEICAYKNVDQRSLSGAIKNLCKKINEEPADHIIIEADDFGSYVCLATIFSGKINSNKVIHCELYNVPIKLFPPNLIPNKFKNSNITVNINYEHEHWLTSFKTLHAFPTEIQFNHNIVYKKAA